MKKLSIAESPDEKACATDERVDPFKLWPEVAGEKHPWQNSTKTLRVGESFSKNLLKRVNSHLPRQWLLQWQSWQSLCQRVRSSHRSQDNLSQGTRSQSQSKPGQSRRERQSWRWHRWNLQNENSRDEFRSSPTALRTKLLTEKMYLRSCNQEVRSRAVSSFPSLSPLCMKSWSLALSAEELCPICERDKKTSHLGGSYMKKRTRRAERKVRPGVIRRPHLVWLKKKMTIFFKKFKNNLHSDGAPPRTKPRPLPKGMAGCYNYIF